MKMTKKLVDLLIGANIKNRKVSHKRVEALARAMKNGTYIPGNGQTIVVNASYTHLLDGQHRLLAIRMAGTYGLDIPVVEIPDDQADRVFDTIDMVKGPRSVNQILALDGDIANAERVASVITCFAKLAGCKTGLNAEEVRSYYYKFKGTIDKIGVYNCCVIGGIRPRVPIQAGVLNSCLLSGGYPDKIIEAYHRVLGNKCETAAESRLLSLIVESKVCRLQDKELFVKTTKALLTDCKCLRMRKDEDVSKYLAKSFVEG